MIPNWWGLLLGFNTYKDEIKIVKIRDAIENPSPKNTSLAQLLWREEAIDILMQYQNEENLHKLNRSILYEKIGGTLPRDIIRDEVVSRMVNREDWRPDLLSV